MRTRKLIPLETRRSLKIRRARVAERLGVWRYSTPALNRLDLEIVTRVGTDPATFLEIGANDGYSQSNTYYLERRFGWNGILVEPIPRLAEWCRRIRPKSMCFERVCATPDLEGQYIEVVDMDLMSVALGQQDRSIEQQRLPIRTQHPEIKVLSQTLSSIIDESGLPVPKFISIDVEGAELAVLAGLDLGAHTPDWLLIETDQPKIVEDTLRGSMTLEAQLSFHDFLYRSR
jgi:FkbM family methyltransferase